MDLCLDLWSRAQAFVVALSGLRLWLTVMLLLRLRIWTLHDSIAKHSISDVVVYVLGGAYLVIHTGRYCETESIDGKRNDEEKGNELRRKAYLFLQSL